MQTFPFDAPGDADFIYGLPGIDTPLVVGAHREKGSYLFSSVPITNVDQYPYFLTHVMRSLLIAPLVRRSGFDAYFNPGDREEVDVEVLVKQWKRSGIRTIYAAAWHRFPQWTYDYGRLIDLAHNNGIRVMAWYGLPFVNERFWSAHPEWRRRDAQGREINAQWQKAMTLENPDCLKAARQEIVAFVQRYDWDGVVFDRNKFMFANITAAMESNWLDSVVASVLPLRAERNLELIVASPPPALSKTSVVQLTNDASGQIARVVFDTEPNATVLPETGLALYSHLQSLLEHGRRVAIDSESTMNEIDRLMLPFIAAERSREKWTPDGIEVTTPQTVVAHLPFAKVAGLSIDGAPSPSFDNGGVILPVGTHRIIPLRTLGNSLQSMTSKTRIADFTGDLLEQRLSTTGLEFTYRDRQKSLMVLTENPIDIALDGKNVKASVAQGVRGFTLQLPSGEHQVAIRTRGMSEVSLAWGSLLLSNIIIIISVSAILCFAVVMLVVHSRRKKVFELPQVTLTD